MVSPSPSSTCSSSSLLSTSMCATPLNLPLLSVTQLTVALRERLKKSAMSSSCAS